MLKNNTKLFQKHSFLAFIIKKRKFCFVYYFKNMGKNLAHSYIHFYNWVTCLKQRFFIIFFLINNTEITEYYSKIKHKCNFLAFIIKKGKFFYPYFKSLRIKLRNNF